MEISSSRFTAVSGPNTYRDQIGRPATGSTPVDQIGRLLSEYQSSVTGVVVGSPQWLLEQTQKLSVFG
jgi:hypothetical protein